MGRTPDADWQRAIWFTGCICWCPETNKRHICVIQTERKACIALYCLLQPCYFIKRSISRVLNLFCLFLYYLPFKQIQNFDFTTNNFSVWRMNDFSGRAQGAGFKLCNLHSIKWILVLTGSHFRVMLVWNLCLRYNFNKMLLQGNINTFNKWFAEVVESKNKRFGRRNIQLCLNIFYW